VAALFWPWWVRGNLVKSWMSYSSKRLQMSWGCQPTGLFEAKFNLHRGTVAARYPSQSAR
jgi:hypothetical protein